MYILYIFHNNHITQNIPRIIGKTMRYIGKISRGNNSIL